MIFLLQIMLLVGLLAPALSIYPNYFGYNPYSAVPAPLFPNIVPQAQPLFTYSIIAPHRANAAFTPAIAAKSIYTAPDDRFRGYAIQTEYEGGGKSEVVFVTGPQANQILQKSVDLFRQIVPSELGQITGRSLNGINATNITVTPPTTPTTPTAPSQPGNANAAAPAPIASMYHVQLYPAATSPYLGPVTPFQNLISSFAYSITNDIANSIKDSSKDKVENAGEAQESMIHEIGAAITATPPNVTTAASATAEAANPTAAPTTNAETTTEATSTTSADPPATTPEPTTTTPTPSEETNEIAESNTTPAPASDEIMETTNT